MTVRATLDSNILVYAELEPETVKGVTAQRVIAASAARGVIAVQAMLEFIAVVRRRRMQSLPSAIEKVDAWSMVFETAPTTTAVARSAIKLAAAHNLQIWDAVIWTAARAAGATLLVSEDLQDGLVLDGMRVVNPFTLSETAFAALLAG